MSSFVRTSARTAIALAGLAASSLPASEVQTEANQACAATAPYGVARRPLPAGREVDRVLPMKVGSFAREAVPARTAIPSDEDFNTTYKSGRDSIFVGLSIPGSVKDLQEGVRVTRQEAVADRSIDRKGEVICLAEDMSFYKIGNFYSWTRGDYFLYAQGSSPAALDAFMAAFPH